VFVTADTLVLICAPVSATRPSRREMVEAELNLSSDYRLARLQAHHPAPQEALQPGLIRRSIP